MRFLFLTALVLFTACTRASPPAADAPRRVVFHAETMGTWASLTIVASDSTAVAGIAHRSLRALHRVDSLMSNWSATSEVTRLNRDAARTETRVHPDVARVIDMACIVARESDGAFDITVEPLVRLWGFLGGSPRVPSQAEIDRVLGGVGVEMVRFDAATATIRFARDDVRIDLGGIAKGYGVDQVADILRAGNVENALIDLSGNMIGLGDAPGHPGWNIGIRDPSGVHPMLGKIVLHDDAVATSGDYEQFVDRDGTRYGHILDPRTGWSARGLTSVTVVATSATLADAWSTALFVLGPVAARETARARGDLAAVLVEPNANGTTVIWVEEELRTRFSAEATLPRTFEVRYF